MFLSISFHSPPAPFAFSFFMVADFPHFSRFRHLPMLFRFCSMTPRLMPSASFLRCAAIYAIVFSFFFDFYRSRHAADDMIFAAIFICPPPTPFSRLPPRQFSLLHIAIAPISIFRHFASADAADAVAAAPHEVPFCRRQRRFLRYCRFFADIAFFIAIIFLRVFFDAEFSIFHADAASCRCRAFSPPPPALRAMPDG